uniref:Uncharacterized protein n=1 Tax=Salix viminalis TaxID=40686 RepID=A0A6N2K7T1_SALVM
MWLVQDVNFPRSSFHTEKSFSLNKHPDCLCKSDPQVEDFGPCLWVVVATAIPWAKYFMVAAPVAALVVLGEKTVAVIVKIGSLVSTLLEKMLRRFAKFCV